ncbi:hypothetical protein PAXINDRAFT_166484 [Paxillus involutus ATCC 200175]|nr:hypothetical protein PAXINDRAFT_166484 [Paxillus involutus ATCC 200175]
MALQDEQADILGGPILQKPVSGFFSTFSQHYTVIKAAALLGLGLLVWIACIRGYEQLKKSRELGYRKAMRRKHGIPDSDCRPFAVAYAAARRARTEREAQERNKTTNHVPDHFLPAVDQRTNARIDAHGLRRRIPETTVQRRPDVISHNFTDRHNPNSRYREVIETVQEPPHIRQPSNRRPRKDLSVHDDATEESRKRSFVDESDVGFETLKKSRIDGEELIDGDEQADWYAQYTDTRSRRGSRDSPDLRVESNRVNMNGQMRSSRINDLQDEDHESADEAMGDVDEDEATELRTVPRGKKRDRVEAGSTFGGDDEEDVQNGKSTHHRKRRTIARRKSEITARGKKRDRDAESPQSEGEGDGSESSRRHSNRSSRKKRGKKATSGENDDTLADDPRVSKDPLCGGRRIGDEWEVDGVQYKVGDKGERLRLTLLKKARNKYHMPKDSQHPDLSAALEIYVETWMTEEQYKEAEERQELAWQDVPRSPNDSKSSDVLESPTKSGKDLLWDSVKGSPARRPFRQSMTGNTAIRINPFQQSQSQPTLGRRVASSGIVVTPILSSVTGSPTRPGFRGFSKWEKQDREAEALAKIRAKMEEQKKAQTPPPKRSEMPTSVTAPELRANPLTIPTITFTPAPSPRTEAKSDEKPSATESKSTTSTFSFATPLGTTDSTKATTAPTATASPSFSLSSTTPPTATPSSLFPGAPKIQTSAPSVPSFSFPKLPQAPSATTTASTALTASSTPSIPNFFTKQASATTPSTTTPASTSSFTLGATTQSQPPPTEATSKPAPFSFAKPSTATSASTPSAATAPTPQLSIFGTGPSNIAPTSAAPTSVFASTPAVVKTETPAPSDSSKPATPLFSFSGTSSTTPAGTAPSAPKFSFGQSSTTSANAPTWSAKPSSTAPTYGASTSVPVAADESKKSAATAPVFGATTGLKNETAKPSPFGGASAAFGGSTFASSSSTNIFGKPATAGGEASASKSIPTFGSSTSNPFSTTPAGSPASGPASTGAFSFGAAGSGSKLTEGSKPPSIFGGGAGAVNPTSVFGGSGDAAKPPSAIGSTTFGTSSPTSTFMFGNKTDAATSASTSAGGAQTKPAAGFTFGGPASSAFGQTSTSASGDRPTQPLFGKPANATPNAFGFGPGGSTGSFSFGKSAGQNQKQEQ